MWLGRYGRRAVIPIPPAMRIRRSVFRIVLGVVLWYGPSRRVGSLVLGVRCLVRPVDFLIRRVIPAVVVFWGRISVVVRWGFFSMSWDDGVDGGGVAVDGWSSAVGIMENGWFSHGRHGDRVGR